MQLYTQYGWHAKMCDRAPQVVGEMEKFGGYKEAGK